MTRTKFRIVLIGVLLVYLGLTGACVAAKLMSDGRYYDLVKDTSTFAAALPVAVLAGAYQMRTSFLQQLREAWKSSLDAVQDAIQFTFADPPNSELFSAVMKKLSVAIDDFRSLYSNLDEDSKSVGYFPFEGLKNIHSALGAFYFGEDFSPEVRISVRNCVSRTWKQVRTPIVAEFDRPVPSKYDSPYVGSRNS
jgi:hypothetical protein